MLMRHVEDPASMGAEDIEGAVQPRARGGRRLGPQGIHHDPGREHARRTPTARRIGYDLMPMRMGLGAAQRGVHPARLLGHPVASRAAARVPLLQPAQHRQGRGVVENADIVLWGTSSSHHEPRDEDGKPELRPQVLARRRRLGRLGPGDVERLRPPPPELLRPDAVLSLHARTARRRVRADPPTSARRPRPAAPREQPRRVPSEPDAPLDR